jgi:plasmid stabilization system protein ParE
MAQIVWTPEAADDFEAIVEYIALDKPDAAANLAKKVIASIERLVEFPLSGRLLPERPLKPYREVVVPPCRIIYLPRADGCEVIRILRGEQHLERGMLP